MPDARPVIAGAVALPPWLRPWRLLPAYVINGMAAALGIGLIQLLTRELAGPHAAAPAARAEAASADVKDRRIRWRPARGPG